MLADTPDKKPIPGNDLSDHPGEEGAFPEKTEENNETDLDDLIHSKVETTIPEDEEFDADDAVHHFPSHTSQDDDSEKDPDDLVHGN